MAKCKGTSLFASKLSENFGEFRTCTLYYRDPITDDNANTLAQLSYPLTIQAIITTQYTSVSEEPHQLNGVIAQPGITHTFDIYRTVDLRMLDYTTPAVALPNYISRNLIVFTDYTSIVEPTGIDNTYVILNPTNAIEDPARPYFKRLYCRWQGRLDKQASLRYD